MHAHLERRCNKLKNVTSKLKIGKSEKLKNLSILCLSFDFVSVHENFDFRLSNSTFIFLTLSLRKTHICVFPNYFSFRHFLASSSYF